MKNNKWKQKNNNRSNKIQIYYKQQNIDKNNKIMIVDLY